MGDTDTNTDDVRSGSYCKCENCGNTKFVPGVTHSGGVSVPFCDHCGDEELVVGRIRND